VPIRYHRRHTARHHAHVRVPAENTNFLQTGVGTVPGVLPGQPAGDPFTYDYEFNQSKLIEQQQLGIPIYGAAIPGSNEPMQPTKTSCRITNPSRQRRHQAVHGLSYRRWTGVGSGYPSAIGYMSPTQEGSVYIAPNMTFDFTRFNTKARPWRKRRQIGRRSSAL